MWAIYWRYMLAVFTLFLLAVLSVQLLSILQNIPDAHYHPTVFWLIATVLSFIATLITARGLVHIFFGEKLHLGAPFWRRISASLTGLFFLLAALGLLVQYASSEIVWANYKLYVQPAVLVLGPFVAGYCLLRQEHRNAVLIDSPKR